MPSLADLLRNDPWGAPPQTPLAKTVTDVGFDPSLGFAGAVQTYLSRLKKMQGGLAQDMLDTAADPNAEGIQRAANLLGGLGLKIANVPMALMPSAQELRDRGYAAGASPEVQAIGGALGDAVNIPEPASVGTLLAGLGKAAVGAKGLAAAAPLGLKAMAIAPGKGRGLAELLVDATPAEQAALKARLEAEAAQTGGQASSVSREQALNGLTGADSNPLLALHNLSDSKLAFADRMGGLAAPSIAVTKPDIPFSSYGDVSLVAPRELIDPASGAKVYGSDVYSPRYPEVVHDIPSNALNKFYKELMGPSKDLKTLGSAIDESKLESRGVEALRESPTVALAYAREKGIPLDPIPSAKYSDAHLSALQEKSREAQIKYNEARNSGNEDDINKAWEAYREVNRAEQAARNANSGVLYDYGRSLLERVRNDPDFIAWTGDKFSSLGGKERIFKGFSNSTGNRMYAPHTLENAVKEMTRNIRAGEGFNYGAGNIRARVTPQFKSVEQMKASSGKLVSKADFDAIKNEINKELTDLSSRFGGGDALRFSENLQEAASSRNIGGTLRQYYRNASDSDIEAASDFLKKLKGLPTEYFEAKIPRAVGIGEFKGALVPDDAPQSTLDILRKQGITNIKTYKRGDEASRLAAMKEIGKGGLQFGIGGIALYGMSGSPQSGLQQQ